MYLFYLYMHIYIYDIVILYWKDVLVPFLGSMTCEGINLQTVEKAHEWRFRQWVLQEVSLRWQFPGEQVAATELFTGRSRQPT